MRKSKLSTYKQRHLIEHFVAGSTARTAASICNVNHKTAAFYCHRLREIIAYELEQEADAVFAGEIDVDESYFGGKRKGRRGRGATGKTPVFGLVKRDGKVYTQVIPNAGSSTLLPIIERKVVPDSIVYSDAWHGYNALDISVFKHYRINHSTLFADKHNHINGIENFWNQAKRHTRKFNGVPKDDLDLQTRIDNRVQDVSDRVNVGNIYINRNQKLAPWLEANPVVERGLAERVQKQRNFTIC